MVVPFSLEMFSACDYVNSQMQKLWIRRAEYVLVNPVAQPVEHGLGRGPGRHKIGLSLLRHFLFTSNMIYKAVCKTQWMFHLKGYKILVFDSRKD